MKAASIKQKHLPIMHGGALLSAVVCASIHVLPVQSWAPHHLSISRQRRSPSVPANHGQYGGKTIFDYHRPTDFATILSVSTSNNDAGQSGAVDEDWRDFRAQLVRSESNDNDDNKPPPSEKKKEEDEHHWAYETGDFVERGSIVISVPSSNEFLDDVDALNNICYRKSIVLVLDVGPNFLQGVVLNRPTNIGVKEGIMQQMQFVRPGHGEVFENEMGNCLGDGCELDEEDEEPHSSARWKVWFGGEVGGPYSDNPQVMCIHSIKTEVAISVSDTILPGIYLTSFDGASQIVQRGEADPSDFWLFSGICGWETSAFYSEMHDEGLWRIVSADSGTILEELNMLRCDEGEEATAMVESCDVDHDPRNAGLHTWEMLMEKIGLMDEVEAHDDQSGGSEGSAFGDLMLHEWATGALSFSIEEEERTTSMIADPRFDAIDNEEEEEEDSTLEVDFDLRQYDPALAMDETQSDDGIVGVMVRASSAKRSPYLLSDQGFHKSLILILEDGDEYSEGILLNHVTSRSLVLDLGDDGTIEMPIRFGGPAFYYDVAEDEDDECDNIVPTVFLHSMKSLRDAGIGISVGKSRLFKCTKEEVIKVLKNDLATVDDFMAVQGFSMWTKKGENSGVMGDVESGFFELVPRPNIKNVWDELLGQEKLVEENLFENVSKSRVAWNAANRYADDNSHDISSTKKEEIHVFGTDIDVMALADEAAMRWVKVNLL